MAWNISHRTRRARRQTASDPRKVENARFRSIMESAIDAIVTADCRGTIRTWNDAAERIFGYTAEEAIGRSLEMIIPERFRGLHRAGMKRITDGHAGRVIGSTVEVAGICKDGSEIPVELSLATWMEGDERLFTGILRDIRERKEAEAKLKAYADELASRHAELKAQHEELLRSQQALMASSRQAARLFSTITNDLPDSILEGKYRLGSKLAEGGFGVVFEATQLALERQVAVKLFRPPTAEGEEAFFERFRREGISSCRVSHPNAVTVIDTGISDSGLPYLVLELLSGGTVAGRLAQDGRFPLRRGLEILADVCGVLAAAHDSGIVHRDIKPSNVFLHHPAAVGGEVVKVLDFGIATLVEHDGQRLARVTQTGQFVGTPLYMAPERISGDGGETGAADVYSVAMMFYELLAAKLPFKVRNDVMATLWMQIHQKPTALQELDPSIPHGASDLALRGLAKRPEDRPTARAMEAELRVLCEEYADVVTSDDPIGQETAGHESPWDDATFVMETPAVERQPS